jgi:HlyD family secretion protein
MFPVIVRVPNQQGLLKPGMNADVQVHVSQRQNVLAVPNAVLRTERDIGSAAMVLGIGDEQLQVMLASARAQRDSAAARAATLASGGTGDSAAARPAPPAASGGNTMEFMGRQITLPAGVTEAQVTAALGRLRQQQATDADRALMQRLRSAGGGGFGNRAGGAAGGPGGGPRQSSVDFQFGGTYLVFVDRGQGPEPVYVRTGLTDLDYSEVLSGLREDDKVLMLPSASLLQQQDEWRARIQRMSGGTGLPGMQQSGTTSGTQVGGAARPGGTTGGPPATPPGGGNRP